MSVPTGCTDTPAYDAINSFKGRGHILCRICGTPVRDHEIGPCPEWDHAAWGNITLAALSTRSMYRRKQIERDGR